MAPSVGSLHVHDLPDMILSNIFSLVVERVKRTSLTLRCNIRNIYQLASKLSLSLTSLFWPLIGLIFIELCSSAGTSGCLPFGSDVLPLLEHCHSLSFLHLSNFYSWTEYIPPALEAHPCLEASLSRHDILTVSSTEGFKSDHELRAITAACPKLHEADPDENVYAPGEAIVSHTTTTLEGLSSKCTLLKFLKLGQFHGICKGIDSQPDGIVLCRRLESLSIKNCPHLTDYGLVAMGPYLPLADQQQRLAACTVGLSSLVCHLQFSRMSMDCGGVVGYALTAPSGIGMLIREHSLPAAGLLAECMSLRKLFIHGTANEHLMFLLRIPNLRDVQLREDYYPAPENHMSTEV
ncbi:hypothetical protein AAG906_029027 [Vitis piasezkii]